VPTWRSLPQKFLEAKRLARVLSAVFAPSSPQFLLKVKLIFRKLQVKGWESVGEFSLGLRVRRRSSKHSELTQTWRVP